VIVMYYKRKKKVKFRGSKTHGYGSMKKHRGAGSRGGRGMAGTGKRGDAKKPSIWKNKKYFGKHGFKSKRNSVLGINISDIEKNLDNLINKSIVKKEKDSFVLDLKDMGYGKLLGKGKATKKFRITAEKATKKAIEIVKKADGEVIIKQKTPKKINQD